MVVLKIVGKILLVPLWIFVVMIWLLVKAVIAVYSFARGFIALGLGLLIVGTMVCYQDWKQVAFLICISGITITMLVAGTLVEVLLENAKRCLGRRIML